MAIVLEDLPRDSNGIVQGAWRLLHEGRNFHGEIGAYTMRHGASTEPACGRPLQRAVAAYGPELYMEPWGALPAGFTLPEMVAHPVPAGIPWRAQPCPWRAQPEPRLPAVLADTLPPPPPEEPKEAAAPVVATETPAPVAGALDHVSDADLEALTLEELHTLAESLGVDDKRFGERRLIRNIREARG